MKCTLTESDKILIKSFVIHCQCGVIMNITVQGCLEVRTDHPSANSAEQMKSFELVNSGHKRARGMTGF